MNTEKIKFQCEGIDLTGIHHAAARGGARAVVISHGFAASKDSDKWVYICDSLAALGISAMRFDHSGCGESGGRFEDVTLTRRIGELRAAVAFLHKHRAIESVALLGSSFGGDTVLFAACDPHVACAATVAAPFTFDFVDAADVAGDSEFIEIDGMRARRALMEDVAMYDVGAQAERVSRLLVMHGTLDDIVPPNDARLIFERAAEPKKLVIVDGADHRFSQQAHRKIMLDHISRWFAKFL